MLTPLGEPSVPVPDPIPAAVRRGPRVRLETMTTCGTPGRWRLWPRWRPCQTWIRPRAWWPDWSADRPGSPSRQPAQRADRRPCRADGPLRQPGAAAYSRHDAFIALLADGRAVRLIRQNPGQPGRCRSVARDSPCGGAGPVRGPGSAGRLDRLGRRERLGEVHHHTDIGPRQSAASNRPPPLRRRRSLPPVGLCDVRASQETRRARRRRR
jgi:hypothetical protein